MEGDRLPGVAAHRDVHRRRRVARRLGRQGGDELIDRRGRRVRRGRRPLAGVPVHVQRASERDHPGAVRWIGPAVILDEDASPVGHRSQPGAAIGDGALHAILLDQDEGAAYRQAGGGRSRWCGGRRRRGRGRRGGRGRGRVGPGPPTLAPPNCRKPTTATTSTAAAARAILRYRFMSGALHGPMTARCRVSSMRSRTVS